MQEFSTYEYTVRQKITGKWLAARILLILFYVLYVVGVLLWGMHMQIIAPLLAFVPLSLWVIVFITWRYTAVEYEYSITSGTLTFTKVYGNRSRKRVISLTLKDAARIAPLDSAEELARANAWRPKKQFTAVSSLYADNIYFILFEYTNRKEREKCRAILYFEATDRALQICRYYNPSSFVYGGASKQ